MALSKWFIIIGQGCMNENNSLVNRAIMHCWLSLASESANNDAVLAGLPSHTVDIHSTAALVTISRTR